MKKIILICLCMLMTCTSVFATSQAGAQPVLSQDCFDIYSIPVLFFLLIDFIIILKVCIKNIINTVKNDKSVKRVLLIIVNVAWMILNLVFLVLYFKECFEIFFSIECTLILD